MRLVPVNSHPEIVTLDAKVGALTTRKSDLETRLQEAMERGRYIDPEGSVNKLFDDPAATLPLADDPEELRQEVAPVEQALSRLQQARSATVARLSQQVCTDLRAEHRKRVQAILAAGRELAAANEAMVQLFDQVESQGYSAGHLRMMQFLEPGNAADRESALRIFERECAEYGFIDRKEAVGARS